MREAWSHRLCISPRLFCCCPHFATDISAMRRVSIVIISSSLSSFASIVRENFGPVRTLACSRRSSLDWPAALASSKNRVPPASHACFYRGLFAFGIILGIRTQSAWEIRTLETASGHLVFLSPVISESYKWLPQNSRPGELVFETYCLHVNFPRGLRNPSRNSFTLNLGNSPPGTRCSGYR